MELQNFNKEKYYDVEAEEKLLSSSLSKRREDESTSEKRLELLDILFNVITVCFSVVTCWRSVWILMDIHEKYFPIYESYIVGLFIHFVFAMSQSFLHDFLVEREPQNVIIKSVNWVLKQIYFELFLAANVLHWRSSYIIFEIICGLSVESKPGDMSVVIATSVTFVILTVFMWIGAMSNLNASLMEVSVDTKAEIYLFNDTFFNMSKRTSLYVLDCLFSIVVVGTLVVFVWRGVWLLIDIFLFPEDEILSSWSSLVLGYICVALGFLLQPIMKLLCERLTGAARLLLADLHILFALFGTVNVWRGIWNLLSIYFLPENLELGCWITHFVSLIILILCRCSNSLLVRGVYIDAEEPGGDCAIFPCYYLRVIFRKKKQKMLNSNVLSLNDSKMNQKEEDAQHNHVVNVSIVSGTVEENNDFKRIK